MKRNLLTFALVALFLGTNAMLLKHSVLADEKTVTGTVAAEKDKDDNVTAVSLTTADNVKYTVTLDENGKKLGKELDGKKAEVTGEVTEKDNKKELTVKSYKKVD